MTLRIDLVRTNGIFSLDGQDFEVENNIWLLGDDDEVLVIDAAHDATPIIDAVGGRNVLGIFLTHGHNDHINVAVALRELIDAPMLLHPADRMLWDVVYPKRPSPTRELLDGDELRVAGTTLRVLHTPGHSPGGVCLLDPDGHVFGGDTLFKGGPGATGRSFSELRRHHRVDPRTAADAAARRPSSTPATATTPPSATRLPTSTNGSPAATDPGGQPDHLDWWLIHASGGQLDNQMGGVVHAGIGARGGRGRLAVRAGGRGRVRRRGSCAPRRCRRRSSRRSGRAVASASTRRRGRHRRPRPRRRRHAELGACRPGLRPQELEDRAVDRRPGTLEDLAPQFARAASAEHPLTGDDARERLPYDRIGRDAARPDRARQLRDRRRSAASCRSSTTRPRAPSARPATRGRPRRRRCRAGPAPNGGTPR